MGSSCGNDGVDKNGGTAAKGYVCKHDGCGKRFTRLEHLNRHALNHKAGDATCSRCRAHFKRRDLLGKCLCSPWHRTRAADSQWLLVARHMERHKKRDEESGGNGILNTRKRLWKHDDGSVVQKRPTTEQPPAQFTRNSEHAHPSLATNAEGPISPPVSHQSSDVSSSLHSREPYRHIDVGLTEDTSLTFSDFSFESTNFQFDADFNEDFCGPPFQSIDKTTHTCTDMPYDEVFQPDTASSFNMPYTTATNYNWLFNLNNDLEMDVTGLVHQEQQQEEQLPQPHLQHLQMSKHQTNIQNSLAHAAPRLSQASHSPQQTSPSSFGTAAFSCSQDAVGVMPSPVSFRRLEATSAANLAAQSTAIHKPPGSIEPERPLATLHPNNSLPCIDDCTREGLLDLIESLHAFSPADEPVTRDNKLLSLSSLQAYLDLFFTRFNTAYPLIHQPTFVASSTERLYLLAMLLLGATYSGKGAHQLAVCIHDVMRPGIFAHAAFSAEPELWILKTILLVECFGRAML